MDFALGAFASAGEIYSIGHWDGTCDLVEVVQSSQDDVTYRYSDGVTHRVSMDYFKANILWKSLRQTWDFMIKLYWS